MDWRNQDYSREKEIIDKKECINAIGRHRLHVRKDLSHPPPPIWKTSEKNFDVHIKKKRNPSNNPKVGTHIDVDDFNLHRSL